MKLFAFIVPGFSGESYPPQAEDSLIAFAVCGWRFAVFPNFDF